jgi:methionyl-tRNA synthetase
MAIKYLVTSALPYVNNEPHLGNIIGSVLSGDMYCRFLKLLGHNALHLCGTDEYGTCTVVKAKKEKVSCKELCDKYHAIHQEAYKLFNIHFDIFGRTTTKEQTELTHEIFFELYKNGYIESKEIEQLYCVKCELYLADRYIQGLCYYPECKEKKNIANGDQCDYCSGLIDPLKFTMCYCTECKTTPEKKKTKHLFLKTGEFTDELKKLKMNMTITAEQITKGLLKQGIESRCITRDLNWGTPVPQSDKYPELKEFASKVFYVWFDAPIGYYSILKHARPNDWKEWLTGKIICNIGKDNVPFHTILFPATLLGSSKLYPAPTDINCVSYLNFENKKFSKSKGIGIFCSDIKNYKDINEDYFRYYLTTIRPESGDSSFSFKDFIRVCQTELVNKIGNYVNRSIILTKKLYDSSEIKITCDVKIEFEEIKNIIGNYINNFYSFKYRNAIVCTGSLAELGNKILNTNEPWKLYKSDSESAKKIMNKCIYISYLIIKLLLPITPRTCERLLSHFKCIINLTSLEPTINMELNVSDYIIPFKKIDL